jgi:hypothetical protein
MSLHNDLLEQAFHLVNREKRRPKQASLRRAVSTAYYALFHLLVDDACKLVLSGTSLVDFGPRIARAFTHTDMKQASRAFVFAKDSPKVPHEIGLILKAVPNPSKDLVTVAKAFVDLQEARHEADYNLGIRYTPHDALASVESAKTAFEAWRRVRSTPLARAYLLSLMLWGKWVRG